MAIYSRDNSEVLSRFWSAVPRQLKREFESGYAAWESFQDDEERRAAMGSFIMELKKREDQRELIDLLENGFIKLKEHYDGKIEGLGSEVRDAVGAIEDRIRQIELSSSETPRLEDRSETRQIPERTESSPSIVVPITTSGNCEYAKKGPENCMRYIERKDGTYGSCNIADQIRGRQILSDLFTSVFNKVGCPTNRVIRKCRYLNQKEIKVK